jgi:cysteine-rich repeat protein
MGTSTMSQVEGDCLESVCDGQGTTTTQNDDTDVLDDGNACTDDICNAGAPENNASPAKTPCSDGTGALCDGSGACVECVDPGDCSSGVCQANACVPPTCLDAIKNGSETDIDCGGADCNPCADAKACAVADDCESGVCAAAVCQAPTCADGVKNDVETDVDCGGGTCSPCGFNEGCAQDSDCVGGSCSGTLCLATCTDQEKNANETDVDCGGPMCGPCDAGKTCAVAADCSSKVCNNGTCAASMCGDGVVNGAEQCDDGNMDDTDACPSTCLPAACGDGFTQAGVEQCDDANQDNTDACLATCVLAACGDTYVQAGVEDCDDANQDNTDACLTTCKAASCGDMYVQAGVEDCDDANQDNTDACPTTCKTAACGDGFVYAGVETCDDGNQSNTDACLNSCLSATCGDSYIQAGVETCDDMNTASGDCCSSGCAIESGCEIEPNNTVAQAMLNPLYSLSDILKGFVTPIGDIDHFTIDVTATIDLKIETFQGFTPGACVSTDTEITLYAQNGTTVLATDDDDGLGTCSLLNPTVDSGVRSLVPGKYYLKVNEFGNNALLSGGYNVQFTVVATCGNGLIESSETCDDGNTMTGDGCSNICRLEKTLESEPNGSCLQANGPLTLKPSPGTLNGGAITPIGDADWYAFTLTSTSDVVFETFDANGPGTCAGVDTVIEAFRGDCVTPLGPAKDQGGITNCSKLDPAVDAQVRHLLPGTYFVKVTDYLNDGVIAGYSLNARLTAVCGNGALEGFEECDGGATCDANCDRIPVCGDAFVDAPESCDDSNTTAGDGCDASCVQEAGFVCIPAGSPCTSVCGDGMLKASELCDDSNVANGDGCDSSCQPETAPTAEVEPNGTFAEADARALDPTPILITGQSTTISGAITPIADKDIFKMTLAAASVVRFETFDGTGSGCAGGITTVLRVFNSDAVPLQLVTDTTTGISSCSAIVYNLAAGSYYVQVEESGNNATLAAYRLQVKVQADKGAESEPNATAVEADPLSGSDVFVFGNHQVQAESDYFAIVVPAGKSLRAEIIEGAAETCESMEVDSRLTLYGPTLTQLVDDDDEGRGYCSLIDGTGAAPLDAAAKALPAGVYYLQVRASSSGVTQGGTRGQFDYRMAVTLR